jgi:excisionase family DNA binding protein
VRSTLEILNIGEVAKLLHLRKRFIYARTRSRGAGSIPHFKVGRLLRFSRTEVLEWFATMHRGGNPARDQFKRIEEKKPVHIQ